MGRILKNELDSLVESGLLRRGKHPDLDLFIYNYTPLTEREEFWTEKTRMSRGLVLDREGNIIIQCIQKFFNRGTRFAAEIDFDNCEITEKNDGYMIQIQRNEYLGLDDEMLVTSRWSFDNKYTQKARELISGYERAFEPGYTYICELLCDFPGDESIIVTRHPLSKLVCFAMINEFGEEIPIQDIPCCLEKVRSFAPDEAKKYLKGEVEGVVLKDKNNQRLKVKTEWFLTRHRLISNCTKKRVWEILRNGDKLEELDLPDEFMPQMKEWELELTKRFNLEWQIILKCYEYAEDLSRKEIALFDIIPKEYKSFVFLLLDDKEQQAMNRLWKKLKPKAEDEENR